MAIVEITANGQPVAINTVLIEHIEGTATKTFTVKKGEMYSDGCTGHPKIAGADTSYTIIDWTKDVKLVMLNGTIYTVKPDQLQILISQGELGLRKSNPIAY